MAISLLPLNEGETLANGIAHYAEYMGLSSTGELRRRLFGYLVREGTRFPCGISHLVLQTQDYWNLDADEIIEKHTEFNYVTMMASANLRSDIRATMRSPPAAGTLRLGLMSGGMRDVRPRYCDECLADWRHAGIEPYCKISHQLPGTYYCDVHFIPLKAAGESQLSVVPDVTLRRLIHKGDSVIIREVNASEKRAIQGVASKGARQQEDGETRKRTHYLNLLRDAGFLMPDGRLKRAALVAELLALFGPTYCHLTGLNEGKIAWWWEFVSDGSKASSLPNPFIFLAVDSLLEAVDFCTETYAAPISQSPVDNLAVKLAECTVPLHRGRDSYGVVTRLRRARTWKVSCSCGLTYRITADSNGLDMHMVPFAYGERYKECFHTLLAEGCSIKGAASELGISVTTADSWRRAKRLSERSDAERKEEFPRVKIKTLRQKWRELVRGAPPQRRITTAYLAGRAIYETLALHDHEWLLKFNRSRIAPRIGRIHSSKNHLTEARLQSVHKAYDELLLVEPPIQVTRAAILRKAGFMSSVRSNSNWSKVLSQLVESRPTYLKRVFSWLLQLPESERPRSNREISRLTHSAWESLSAEQKNRVRAMYSFAGSDGLGES
ncbi:hypothetical protein BC1002_4133 [Paraburkholderia atlantica]|uniref:Uncharacterized protein n=1 Tax=Paraburkholderia atlantica TaxID=2654982 RepID=D5WI36_PARAM|nr:hypothetical protein BC1002_4133 [Paraburkholderia atlantica]